MKRSFVAPVSNGRVEETRLAFSTQVRSTEWNDGLTISIDESSFHTAMVPNWGYSPRGRRLHASFHTRGGRHRISLLLAVSSERVVGHEIVEGSFTSAIFARFLERLDAPQGSRILMDNAAIHKTRLVRDACGARGFHALFLPPYTPHWQPVEHCFSVMKNAFRRTGPSVSMTERIATSIDRLTPVTLSNVFRKCHALARINSIVERA